MRQVLCCAVLSVPRLEQLQLYRPSLCIGLRASLLVARRYQFPGSKTIKIKAHGPSIAYYRGVESLQRPESRDRTEILTLGAEDVRSDKTSAAVGQPRSPRVPDAIRSTAYGSSHRDV